MSTHHTRLTADLASKSLDGFATVAPRPSHRALLSTSALAGGALRGLVLASGAAAGLVVMGAPADAFTCVDFASGTNQGATDNGNGNATACGPSANADGSQATATGVSSVANGGSATATGDFANANGGFATATGGAATANGIDATATGTNATANGMFATATGVHSFANGDHSRRPARKPPPMA